MSDFEVRGADDFLRLSKALKRAGRTEFRKELNKALKDATKPLIKDTQNAAQSQLPSSGGLAAQVAKEPQRVQVRTGRDPGVRIVVGKRRGGARGSDAGRVRHPVFGNRDRWVTQSVQPGWFSETLRDAAPTVRPHLEQALEDIAQKIVREAR